MIGDRDDVHFAPPENVTEIDMEDFETFAFLLDVAKFNADKKALGPKREAMKWKKFMKSNPKGAYKKYHRKGEHHMTTYSRMFKEYQRAIANMNKERFEAFNSLALSFVANYMTQQYLWVIKVGASMPGTEPALGTIDAEQISAPDSVDVEVFINDGKNMGIKTKRQSKKSIDKGEHPNSSNSRLLK
jgi:hypothetical protein